MIRINKYLSQCGVSSRRGAETLIAEGRITINDKAVEKPGTLVDETADVVKLDGLEVTPVEKKIYLVLNKPTRVMTTLSDPFKRKTILHYLKDIPIRVYPIGRLDYDTTGVLLLTNDGDLAYTLAHPKFQIPKVYQAQVKGRFTEVAAHAISNGIKLEDGAVGKAQVKIIKHLKNVTELKLILKEGRKREVKQLCKAVGHPVIQLRRTEFAGITSRGLKPGMWRYLTSEEIESLNKMAKEK